ncbi:protein SENSITIVITY TO RED LIGHT REDUCED 1 [Typha angustifolia]|uniref:protein SENSITIVITY TO RED LIGHT REDUCED 1 n=1 Tax=Typha angustifolia TaxID=59011 RepID=UPI003C2DCC6F
MAAAPAAKTPKPNPNPNGEWTLVLPRRVRRLPNQTPYRPVSSSTQTLTPSPPSPWAPHDPIVDPARVSNLLQRMQSTIVHLEGSQFYRRLLSRFNSPQIQRGVSRVSPTRMVVYGIGSIESYAIPRLQLALAVLLRREMGPAMVAMEVFDPILSATECAVAAALGCVVGDVDEKGRRAVTESTLFYMPHCEVGLYDGLLEANWKPSALNRMVVLGNSFSEYASFVSWVRLCGKPTAAAKTSRHVIGVRKYVEEVGMQDGGKVDEEDRFLKAFHDTSWHFFELDDDTQMDVLIE